MSLSSSRAFKHAVFEEFGRIGKALSSPRRIELLELLSQAPRTVDVLAHITGQSVANTSHHLLVLRASGLVKSTKAGVFVTYRLADDTVSHFFDVLRQVTEARSAEIRRLIQDLLHERGLPEEVDREALVNRVRRGPGAHAHDRVRGVSPSLPPPRPPDALRAHSLLRLPRVPLPNGAAPAMPSGLGRSRGPTRRITAAGTAAVVAVSSLRRRHAHHRAFDAAPDLP
jgi:DNA-binding transcriptional ArsR family regulator